MIAAMKKGRLWKNTTTFANLFHEQLTQNGSRNDAEYRTCTHGRWNMGNLSWKMVPASHSNFRYGSVLGEGPRKNRRTRSFHGISRSFIEYHEALRNTTQAKLHAMSTRRVLMAEAFVFLTITGLSAYVTKAATKTVKKWTLDTS